MVIQFMLIKRRGHATHYLPYYSPLMQCSTCTNLLNVHVCSILNSTKFKLIINENCAPLHHDV